MDRDTTQGWNGWGHGLLAVVIFSGSLPATRLAVIDLPPLFLTSARALIASLLAGLVLALTRQPLPTHRQWQGLAVVAGGCVIGFPLLSALALQGMSSARSLVFSGLLPLSTALFAVLRGGERPSPLFWIFALAGAGAVAGFALSHGATGTGRADGLMVLGVLVCGLGYAEGTVLTRQLGGWQVIGWALLPCAAPAALGTLLFQPSAGLAAVHWTSWLGLGYVSIFSMLIGFVFWYRGLSLGGIARVGQLQLLQPLLGLVLAAWLLHEPIAPAMLGATLLVIGSVAGARRFA